MSPSSSLHLHLWLPPATAVRPACALFHAHHAVTAQHAPGGKLRLQEGCLKPQAASAILTDELWPLPAASAPDCSLTLGCTCCRLSATALSRFCASAPLWHVAATCKLSVCEYAPSRKARHHLTNGQMRCPNAHTRRTAQLYYNNNAQCQQCQRRRCATGKHIIKHNAHPARHLCIHPTDGPGLENIQQTKQHKRQQHG